MSVSSTTLSHHSPPRIHLFSPTHSAYTHNAHDMCAFASRTSCSWLHEEEEEEKTEKQIRRLRSLINYIVLFVSHLNRTTNSCIVAAAATVNVMVEPKNKNAEKKEEEKLCFVVQSTRTASRFNNCARLFPLSPNGKIRCDARKWRRCTIMAETWARKRRFCCCCSSSVACLVRCNNKT